MARLRDTYGMFIDGKEVSAHSGKTFEVRSPVNLDVLCRVSEGDAVDMDRAVLNGAEAFADGRWSRMDPKDRCRIMFRAAAMLAERVPEMALLESKQTGRAIREMNAQLGRLPEWFEYYGALIRTAEGSVPPFYGPYVNYLRRLPLGVVGQITPWNHPLLIAIKKIAPALAAGNSVVVKPSELAPATVLEFAQLCSDAGVPDGVLNIVPGMGAGAGKALAENPIIRKLDLTGGTPTGRVVAAAAGRNLVSVVAELGGKAPMIVFEDADIEQTVNGCAFGSFVATGQTCIMGARLLVHESIFDEVVSRYVAKAQRIRVGDPADPATQMGPVISAAQLQRVSEFVDRARADGATVLCGGGRPEGLPDALSRGHYYAPTVIGNVTPDMHVVREEVFGPVVVAYSFRDEAEAVALANDSPYGLAAAVWTRDVKRAHRVADRLDVGIVWINDHHRNDPSSPWGGTKDSGMGRENGIEALHEYSAVKSVVVGTSDEPFDWFVDQEGVRYS